MKLSIKLIIFSIVLFTLNSCSFSDLPIIGCVKPNSNSSIPLDKLLSSPDESIIDDKEYFFHSSFIQKKNAKMFEGCCGKFVTSINLPKGYIADKVWLLYLDRIDKKNIFIENDLVDNKNGSFSYSISNLDDVPNLVVIRVKKDKNEFFIKSTNFTVHINVIN